MTPAKIQGNGQEPSDVKLIEMETKLVACGSMMVINLQLKRERTSAWDVVPSLRVKT